MQRKQYSIRLPEWLVSEIDRLAKRDMRDRTNLIEVVLTRYVRSEQRKEKKISPEKKFAILAAMRLVQDTTDEEIASSIVAEVEDTLTDITLDHSSVAEVKRINEIIKKYSN